ncbi:macrophage migration inhibitory factor-like [Lytechinus variegatus]|uniref:macrophage migration inhibitory factor-like n=1 Tax=Lytechinus variegatus TaxID=7654 RepID=UPI001BB10DF6|nr:macrophage migration inhibitory factor-like [Lytechinus variegatus]
MPTLTVYTNVPRQDFPDNFLADTVKLVCRLLNKPFKGVAVILCNDVEMLVGEAIDQVINVQVIGVGDFQDEVKNDQFVSAILEYLHETTGTNTESISVSLKDLLPIQIGFAGGELAFDKIQKRKLQKQEEQAKSETPQNDR